MGLETITRRASLIRKALDAVVLIAPITSPAVTSITTGAGGDLVDFATVHNTYVSLGRHTKDDGLAWSNNVETSDVMSHGATEPTRRDITTDTIDLQVGLQETRRQTLELVNRVDLSAVTPTATTGEIDFNKATTPQTTYYRILALGQDGFGTDRIYFARFLPRAMVSSIDSQTWSDSGELRYPVTFTATVDDVLGYSMREMWGGPAWQTALTDMGFPALT